MREHVLDAHFHRRHIDPRYPFISQKLEVIAALDEERYNKVIRPQNLPLREGICVLFEMPTYSPEGISRLNWHRDNPGDGTGSGWAPIPRPLIASRSMDRMNPNLSFWIYQPAGRYRWF